MKKYIMAILIKTRKICQKLEFMSGILQKDTTKTYLAKYRFILMDYYARFSCRQYYFSYYSFYYC